MGHTDLKLCVISTLFAQCVRTLFALVRCCDTMPVDWVSAQACPLDKKNGKERCEAVKKITVVEEMGNSFVEPLLERGIRGRFAQPYASGYQHGRFRLEAILHQRVIAHRARVAGRNFAIASKDVKNAFASLEREQQHACLGARLLHVDSPLSTISSGCQSCSSVCRWRTGGQT